MLILPPQGDSWRLLTEKNIRVRRQWGWGHSIQKIIAATEAKPAQSGRLLIASDYGGEHSAASHHIYCYLVIRSAPSQWYGRIQDARRRFVSDGRRMAYKRLDDGARQRALVPFLAAAADLDAHLVAIAVDKRKKWLSIAPSAAGELRNAFGLRAPWKPQALEAMMRKVQFMAILLSIWSRNRTHVTWITDQDEFVANDVRHDDALRMVGQMGAFYLSHPMGEFRLNTTGQDLEATDFEDFCAIPDLAAGMLAEISNRLAKQGSWGTTMRKLEGSLPLKAQAISDWFWCSDMRLRKTFISVDVEGSRYGVRRVWSYQGYEQTPQERPDLEQPR